MMILQHYSEIVPQCVDTFCKLLKLPNLTSARLYLVIYAAKYEVLSYVTDLILINVINQVFLFSTTYFNSLLNFWGNWNSVQIWGEIS